VSAPYLTDDAAGDGWNLMLGDSCERLAEVDDATVDLTVYPPPFSQLFVYSPSERDLGNSRNHDEFIEHYRFIVAHLLRVTKPGRLVAVHCAQVPTQKWRDGAIGLRDFRGDLIRAHVDAGFVFHGEATVWKNPQNQAVRTKASSLLFVTLERDSTGNRPCLADYVLVFRAPGDNAVPVKPECTRDEWIEWAAPIWRTDNEPTDGIDAGPFAPCWFDIRETNTLNTAAAKESTDERHICPLQLDLIERVVRLWSNPGELVLSPFAGIGSEGFVAVQRRRRFVGVELKASYFEVAKRNLERAAAERDAGTLFEPGAA